MKRRDFIALSAAISVAPALPAFASMADFIEYKPGLVTKSLKKGETVFLDFSAPWCSTCAAQARVIDTLKAENSAYAQAITFYNVDWDTYSSGKLATRLSIPRRSTLVVLLGDEELGRVVAGTSRAVIKELMDIALNAASA
jgi:thioredoxin 1